VADDLGLAMQEHLAEPFPASIKKAATTAAWTVAGVRTQEPWHLLGFLAARSHLPMPLVGVMPVSAPPYGRDHNEMQRL
jgi:hypothetical protein